MPIFSFLLLQPERRVRSVTDIPLSTFTGVDLVVLDIDNTLAEPETTIVPQDIQSWVHALRARVQVVCVSNSLHMRHRRKVLEERLGCPVLRMRAKKPFLSAWRAIERLTGVRPSPRTVVIGDRVFSDVFFGNRVGAATILTEPFSSKEAWWLRNLVRPLERWLVPPASRN